jgi:hypothetical protein
MGMQNTMTTDIVNDYGIDVRMNTSSATGSPPPEGLDWVQQKGFVSDWIEIWDYVGGIRFRGFVADKAGEKAMVVFFDENVIGGDLKAG